MKIEEPAVKVSVTVTASSVEEAKASVRQQMSNPIAWQKFWKDLHQLLIANGYEPKWQPEDQGLPIEIGEVKS